MNATSFVPPSETPVARFAGILYGMATQLIFALTAWRVFHFLSRTPGVPSEHALFIDSLLALQFAVSHSFFLWPPVRRRLGRWISRSFYGCSFSLMTCLSLSLVIWQWRTVPVIVWQTSTYIATAVWLGYIGSWIGLFYSVALTGPGYQSGFTEWFHWVRRRPLAPRTFTPRGAYFVLRHPVYLSFLGLIWFTPTMTLDRALLTGVWTIYIYLGSWLKDRRLAFYLGDSYREYASRVSGYPGMLLGPLARWTPTTIDRSDN